MKVYEKTEKRPVFWKRKGFLGLAVVTLLMIVAIVLADLGLLPVSWLRIVPDYDRLGHIVIYGIFYSVLSGFLDHRKITISVFRISLAGLITGSVILMEEFSQLFINTRTFDLVDIYCGFLGLLISAHTRTLLKNQPVNPNHTDD
jgi:VanZ family protein